MSPPDLPPPTKHWPSRLQVAEGTTTAPERNKPWKFAHLTIKQVYQPLARSSGRILELMKAQKANSAERHARLHQFMSAVGVKTFLAISARSFLISASARAFPPLRPPLRASATAAGTLPVLWRRPAAIILARGNTHDALGELVRHGGAFRGNLCWLHLSGLQLERYNLTPGKGAPQGHDSVLFYFRVSPNRRHRSRHGGFCHVSSYGSAVRLLGMRDSRSSASHP